MIAHINSSCKRVLPVYPAAFFFLIALGCGVNDHVHEIRLSSPGNNVLIVKAELRSSQPTTAYLQYWKKDDPATVVTTAVSERDTLHVLGLTRLSPETNYEYRVATKQGNAESFTGTYGFRTGSLPLWLREPFLVMNPRPENIPPDFQKGLVMFYKREEPGIIYFVNVKGEVEWYHTIDNTGFKVAHYTPQQTVLAILGDASYATNYGNQIMEISATGDTLLHLTKGEKDFQHTLHHEIRTTPQNHILAITSIEKVFDLTSIGGQKQDTVKGDGIIVLNREGKRIWEWSVFDVMNPLDDKNILKEKDDWLHANSLSYAPDGNYLLSFYNTGQVWKIDAVSGKLIWRFGNGGDFASDDLFPEQCHAAHYDKDGHLMLFDNGNSRRISHVYTYALDETGKTAKLKEDIALPQTAFSERMGSAYRVNDTAVLVCASKRNTIILSKTDGTYLWMMNTKGIGPYRAAFIPFESLP